MIKKKGSDQLLKLLKGDAGTVIGTVKGIKTGVTDTIETAWSVAKGSVNFAEKPAESTQKASCSFCADAASALFLVYFLSLIVNDNN